MVSRPNRLLQDSTTLISLIIVESTLIDFEKFHPPQNEIRTPRLLISLLLKCLILLQNLMKIFLTVILSFILAQKMMYPLQVYSNLHVY